MEKKTQVLHLWLAHWLKPIFFVILGDDVLGLTCKQTAFSCF
jgi:hypothetical protein